MVGRVTAAAELRRVEEGVGEEASKGEALRRVAP